MLEQQMQVFRDAALEGDRRDARVLGRALAARQGLHEMGLDDLGIWGCLRVNDVVLRLRWVWPGRFVQGSPPTEVGRFPHEGPQREVVLTRGFWLDETPVTQALWEALMGENPSWCKSPNRPVERVSWHECEAFCERLRQRLPGLAARLPTEAEWEYACRAGTMAATWVGDPEILGACNAPLLDEIAWYSGNAGVDYELSAAYDSSVWQQKQYAHERAGTRQVATRSPNPWGLYDMLGNVFEWCTDGIRVVEEGSVHRGFRSYPVPIPYEPGGVVDPTSAGPQRVSRGGGWSSPARAVRAACRFAVAPEARNGFLGFRLAVGPTVGGFRPEG